MNITKWKMSYENFRDIECVSPCSMYSVLEDNSIIENPFYGFNEEKYTCLSEKDCEFTSEFLIDDDILKNDYTEIVLSGLDTLCDIYINGKVIASVENMHISYRFDIKPYIHKGSNSIKLYFHSPLKFYEKANKEHYLWGCGNCYPGAPHLRKAFCMSEWDWAPSLPDMGIYGDVCIDSYNTDKIADVNIEQKHFENRVDIVITAETLHNSDDTEMYVTMDSKRVKLSGGRAELTIENPRLWYVRGYGEQPLYDVTVEMLCGGEVTDSVCKKVGLRTLTVSTEKDEYGSEFCFVINGIKIFAMGGNYIPQDSIFPRITKERVNEMLEGCRFANYNIIRVWAGGYYPNDEFYDFCDREGIIVWQDFMFAACANIWLSDRYKKLAEIETESVLKRYRTHPSLGLLCGNNEVEEALCFWKCSDNSPEVLKDYLAFYEDMLPKLCRKYAPSVFYWQSSPSSGGNFDNAKDETRGDMHYWEVNNNSAPLTEYRKHKFRFCSEFGFQGMACMKTIEAFCPPEERNLFSRTMENHQKLPNGNSKILTYVVNEYLYPSTLEKFAYASQILQAYAIGYAVEHFRRLRGRCMGSIYWQIGDCWPVPSCASIDYFGRYKALHYAAKNFYAPISLGLFSENGVITVNVSNETLGKFDGRLEISFIKNNLSVCGCKSFSVTADALSSTDAAEVKTDGYDIYDTFVCIKLIGKDGNVIQKRTELLCKAKHFKWLKPEFSVKTKIHSDKTLEVCVSANVFVKSLYIETEKGYVNFDNNFADITDSEPCVFRTLGETCDSEVKLMSVYDIDKY